MKLGCFGKIFLKFIFVNFYQFIEFYYFLGKLKMNNIVFEIGFFLRFGFDFFMFFLFYRMLQELIFFLEYF